MSDEIGRNIRALAAIERPPSALPAIEPVGGRPAVRGRSDYAASAPGAGGGPSGELTELPGTRTYWPAATIMPADGFFFYSVKAVKTLTFNGLTMHLEKPDYGSGEE